MNPWKPVTTNQSMFSKQKPVEKMAVLWPCLGDHRKQAIALADSTSGSAVSKLGATF